MKQREVTDPEGLRWTCAQAYAGVDGEGAEMAQRLAGRGIDVVCTPSGGAKSVRLSLRSNWTDLDDAALLGHIEDARGE